MKANYSDLQDCSMELIFPKKSVIRKEIKCLIQDFNMSDYLTRENSNSPLFLSLKECRRINSQGVILWLSFLEEASKLKMKIVLLDCSSSFIDYVNLYPQMIEGVEVRSLSIPLFCKSCSRELHAYCGIENVSLLIGRSTMGQCPFCGGHASLDDDIDRYLSQFAKS